MSLPAIDKTIELLGQIIQKPPLNQKLLSRPPFRYIHDIFSEVINTTGYFTGLYTDDEMMSENVKDKESKVAYLNKMIRTLGYIHEQGPDVDSYKVIAGLDADATNALLQMLAETVLQRLPFESAVNKVLDRNQPPQTQDPVKQAKIPGNYKAGKEEKAVPIVKSVTIDNTLPKKDPNDILPLNEPENKSITKGTTTKTEPINSKASDLVVQADVETKKAGREKVDNVLNDRIDDKQMDAATSDLSLPLSSGYTRPMTARAPPPKAKKAEVVQEPVAISSAAILKEGVVDEEEFFDDPGNNIPQLDDSDFLIEKDGLVAKLLQTKKDLEEDRSKQGASDQPDPKKTISPQEIEVIRQSIQLLCKSTQPLGKMVDYIQEDMDGMSKELLFWRKESAKYEKKLREEGNSCISQRDERHEKLGKIIEEQMEKIRILKSDIFRKDMEIMNYLSTLSKPVAN